jgi:hypothetical protein
MAWPDTEGRQNSKIVIRIFERGKISTSALIGRAEKLFGFKD